MLKTKQYVKQELVQKPLTFLPAQGVPAESLPFQKHLAVRTWKKYGIEEVPLWVKSASGKLYDDKKFKGLFFWGNYRRIVSRNYTVIPNEEIDAIVHEYVRRSKGKLNVYKYSKKIKGGSSYDSHFGDAAYWELRSNQWETVEGDDTVQIGCMVRNSVGTYVALGADLYTFRKWCSNGAIAKGIDFGSIAIRHMSERDKILENFGKGLEKILDRTTDLIDYYRKSTKMRLNQKIAEEWAKRIPQRCLPKSVAVNHKTKAVTLKQDQNLWEAFNDITKEAWRPEKKETGFLSKHYITSYAHKVLVHAIDHKGAFGRKVV